MFAVTRHATTHKGGAAVPGVQLNTQVQGRTGMHLAEGLQYYGCLEAVCVMQSAWYCGVMEWTTVYKKSKVVSGVVWSTRRLSNRDIRIAKWVSRYGVVLAVWTSPDGIRAPGVAWHALDSPKACTVSHCELNTRRRLRRPTTVSPNLAADNYGNFGNGKTQHLYKINIPY